MTETPEPGYYEWLDFNAPLSSARADAIARDLAAGRPRTVLDLGCGWGELLLRTVAAGAEATGLGVDTAGPGLDRGRATAVARGLDERVAFLEGDCTASRDPADVVICVGADHAFGDQSAALAALGSFLLPGGRLLSGSGFWRRPPSAEQAAAVGMPLTRCRTWPAWSRSPSTRAFERWRSRAPITTSGKSSSPATWPIGSSGC